MKKRIKTKTKTWVIERPRVLGWGAGKIGLSYGLNFDGFRASSAVSKKKSI